MISKIEWIFSTKRGYKATDENTTLPIYVMFGSNNHSNKLFRTKNWFGEEYYKTTTYKHYIDMNTGFLGGTNRIIIHYD